MIDPWSLIFGMVLMRLLIWRIPVSRRRVRPWSRRGLSPLQAFCDAPTLTEEIVMQEPRKPSTLYHEMLGVREVGADRGVASKRSGMWEGDLDQLVLWVKEGRIVLSQVHPSVRPQVENLFVQGMKGEK